MTPLELKPEAEWHAILDRLFAETTMAACLSNGKGEVLFCRGERFPLCAAIKGTPTAATYICGQTNTAMLAVVKRTLRPAIDLCEAGLLRMVIPIVRDGALVGQVFACGLAAEGEELDPFMVAKQLGVGEERVTELASATRAISEAELTPVADRFFRELNP